jgi:hypothetical protein
VITVRVLRSTRLASKSRVGPDSPRRRAARRCVIACCVPANRWREKASWSSPSRVSATALFARYIARLIARGARVAVACNPTIRPLFERVAGIEKVLAPPADQPPAQINLAALSLDAWTPLLSLAFWFETDVESVPAETPYWTPRRSASPNGSAGWPAWRPVPDGAAKVGLVFQAGVPGQSKRRRVRQRSVGSCRSPHTRESTSSIFSTRQAETSPTPGRAGHGRAGPSVTDATLTDAALATTENAAESPNQPRPLSGSNFVRGA